jgi:hypothetical protein
MDHYSNVQKPVLAVEELKPFLHSCLLNSYVDCGINYSVLQAIVVIIRSFVIPSFFKQLQNLYGDFFIRSTFIWVKIYTGQNLYRSKFIRSKFILVILEAFSNCVFIVRWCCGGAMSNLSSSIYTLINQSWRRRSRSQYVPAFPALCF